MGVGKGTGIDHGCMYDYAVTGSFLLSLWIDGCDLLGMGVVVLNRVLVLVLFGIHSLDFNNRGSPSTLVDASMIPIS